MLRYNTVTLNKSSTVENALNSCQNDEATHKHVWITQHCHTPCRLCNGAGFRR